MRLNQHQFGNALRHTTTGLTLGAVGATMAVSGMTHEAPLGDYQPMGPVTAKIFAEERGLNDPKQMNIPRWNRNLSQQFPGFRNMEKKPDDYLNSHVVGVDSGNEARVYPAQKAWNLNTDDERANNIWMVGYK